MPTSPLHGFVFVHRQVVHGAGAGGAHDDVSEILEETMAIGPIPTPPPRREMILSKWSAVSCSSGRGSALGGGRTSLSRVGLRLRLLLPSLSLSLSLLLLRLRRRSRSGVASESVDQSAASFLISVNLNLRRGCLPSSLGMAARGVVGV